MRKFKRALIAILVMLIICLVAVGGYAYLRLRGIVSDPRDILGSMLDRFDLSKTVTYKGEKYVYNKDIVTLMLIGLDEDDGRSSARSDMMVVVALDTAGNKAKMIVCPRDTRTNIRHTDKNGNTTKDAVGKLNSSFPYGNGNNNKKMGGENVAYNVSRLLSCGGKYTIPLEKFGGINMQGIGPLTTAVGGVTITLPAGMNGVGQKGQTVTLDAHKAELYTVSRKGVGDGSDISRGQRQMVYLMSLMQRIKSMSATSIVSVYSSVSKYAFTNLSTDEMVAYAAYLRTIPSEDMEITQLQGVGKTISGGSYYVLNEAQLEELVIKTFYKKI